MSNTSLFYLLFLIPTLLASIAQSSVPTSATFKYVNQGKFGEYIVEYDGTYRVTDIFSNPFQLIWYNTTPNAYYLALRVGLVRSTSLRRWVWEFNRGKPVRENATFSLGTDGNLVLADDDGRVAWQSGTTNKGVTGFKLLSNGNMVLHNGKGNFIWQSFDHPTDTILMGQSLRPTGPNILVSRASSKNNVNGPYSLVVNTKGLYLYYKSKNSPSPQLYFTWSNFTESDITHMRLDQRPDGYSGRSNAYEIVLEFSQVVNPTQTMQYYTLAETRYNSSITYLRLGIDGRLTTNVYDQEANIMAWEVLDLFSSSQVGRCQLPEKCGKFGLCDNGQCVACPSPNGLLGWSESCRQPKVSSCDAKNVKYYKLVGVDHFTVKHNKGEGPMEETDCSRKCTTDCKCAGYFYHKNTGLCWIAYDVMTLAKVADKNHLGFVKY